MSSRPIFHGKMGLEEAAAKLKELGVEEAVFRPEGASSTENGFVLVSWPCYKKLAISSIKGLGKGLEFGAALVRK